MTEEQKNGALSLVALYQLNGKEVESFRIPVTVAPEAATAAANKVRNFLNSSFTVPDVFDSKYNTLTMEFWLKPTSLSNYNQQIGLDGANSCSIAVPTRTSLPAGLSILG